MSHEITLAFQRMAEECREIDIAKGWRNADGSLKTEVGTQLALIHSEVSEALEAFRVTGLADATRPYDNMDSDTGQVKPAKPEGVGAELADALIRLINFADATGISLVYEYHRKVAYNRTRPYRHGGKLL